HYDSTSSYFRPMNRLMENTVFFGFVMACRRATWPTSRSPSFVNAPTDGVVRPPSAFGITTGSPPTITATTEFVVPRSMPITFAISSPLTYVSKKERPRIRVQPICQLSVVYFCHIDMIFPTDAAKMAVSPARPCAIMRERERHRTGASRRPGHRPGGGRGGGGRVRTGPRVV